MKKQLNITEGKAEIIEHNWSDTSIEVGGKTLTTLSIYEEATEETQEDLENEMSSNAHLIADAFNTSNETQLLPSELKQQRDELYQMLVLIKSKIDLGGLSYPVKQLINKTENNE